MRCCGGCAWARRHRTTKASPPARRPETRPVPPIAQFIFTRVQTAQQEALIRKPIKELVAELDPTQFWQIHRSTLVNARAVAGVSRDFRGRQLVSLKGRPEKLEVSRSLAHLFKGM